MTPQVLPERTMRFAVRVLKLADAMPRTASGRTVSSQVARTGCSIAASYRSALCGKSRADFINKIVIVLEEAGETAFWLELTARAKLLPTGRLSDLRDEADQLTRIFNATRTTARNRKS